MPRLMSVLRRGFAVALHEVRFARRFALERALPEEALHERADVEPDLRPERLVVRLEHHPLRAAIERSPRGTAPSAGPERTSIPTRVGRFLPECARPRRRGPLPASREGS